jgi:hypothetical protein
MIAPTIKYTINTNFKKPNINLDLICCEEQILFGLLRLKNLNYHIRDSEKRLIDFIYGRHVHEKPMEFNAELIFDKDSKIKTKIDFAKNLKDNRENICKFYNIDFKLKDNEIKEKILEKINLSFLR